MHFRNVVNIRASWARAMGSRHVRKPPRGGLRCPLHRATPLSWSAPGPEALRSSIAAGLPWFGGDVSTPVVHGIGSMAPKHEGKNRPQRVRRGPTRVVSTEVLWTRLPRRMGFFGRNEMDPPPVRTGFDEPE